MSGRHQEPAGTREELLPVALQKPLESISFTEWRIVRSKQGILSIATCQHPVGADINTNLSAIIKLAKIARSKQADIAHFSECNLTVSKYRTEGKELGELIRGTA